MYHGRLFSVLNLLLVGVCFFCVWYLAKARYVEPREIAAARKLIIESSAPETGPALALPPVAATIDRAELTKNGFNPLFTPTPTPTPEPPPPPPPPDLASAVGQWSVQSLGKGKAVFFDGASQQVVKMTVAGASVEVNDKDGRPVQVTLREVNLREAKAVLGFEDQVKDMAM